MQSKSTLAITLSLAVPLWQHKLKQVPWADLLERVAEAGKIIAERGDNLLYRSSVPGETANLFNRTAEAIAILSFLPGGVRIFGEHYIAQHPELRSPKS